MATVAISATTSPSQQAGGPPVTQKQPRSRMFRSISRFLSGGTNKQRPKHQTADLPQAASTYNNDESAREQARAESSRGTSSSSRSGSDTEEEEEGQGDRGDDGRSAEGEELSTRAVRRFPRNDSVSRYSAVSGADTEASLYAMASTRPGSSLHTVDSSSHASSVAPSGHASTHKSYASTKPTTLLSVDSLGGANRIAVVPGTGTGNYHASPGGTSTGLSFASVLPSTPPQSSPLANAAAGPSGHRRGTSASSSSSFNSYDPAATDPGIAFSIAPDSPSSGTSGPADRRHDGVNVPNFSHPHPRNNPHPAYPAQDNASILTLASSSFAPSFIGSTGGESKTRANSWGGGGLGGLRAWSSKQPARSLGGGGARSLMTPDGVGSLGGGGSGGVAADEDASVRALPGSRRASNESLGSRSTWSAAPKDATPSVRSRPLEDELTAAATGAGSGRAASTSPSKKERRTSMRTVETAPSVRSAVTDRRETEEEDDYDDGNGSAHQDDAVSATEEGTAPAVTQETAAEGETTLIQDHRRTLLSPRRADSDLATTASAAESFRTAPEVGDDRTSIASSTAAAAAPAVSSHPGEMELAPPVPDIKPGSPAP